MKRGRALTEKPLVSVIIPVYNAERTLRRCVESVLAQTYRELEVILVDDGSRDNSGRLCEALNDEYTQVRTVHQENMGVSSSRNLGMQQSRGQYIQFVDADDYLNPEMTFKLVEAARDGADLVIASYVEVDSRSGLEVAHMLKARRLSTMDDFLAELPDQKVQKVNSCWNKLFRTELIQVNNICFDTSMDWAEDTVFSLSYLAHCETVTVLDHIGYFYDNSGRGENLMARFRPDLYVHSRRSFEALQYLYKARPKLQDTMDVLEQRYAASLATGVVPHLARNTPLRGFFDYAQECRNIREDPVYLKQARNLKPDSARTGVLLFAFRNSRFELVYAAGRLAKVWSEARCVIFATRNA